MFSYVQVTAKRNQPHPYLTVFSGSICFSRECSANERERLIKVKAFPDPSLFIVLVNCFYRKRSAKFNLNPPVVRPHSHRIELLA
jgi:hypothetical protein